MNNLNKINTRKKYSEHKKRLTKGIVKEEMENIQ